MHWTLYSSNFRGCATCNSRFSDIAVGIRCCQHFHLFRLNDWFPRTWRRPSSDKRDVAQIVPSFGILPCYFEGANLLLA